MPSRILSASLLLAALVPACATDRAAAEPADPPADEPIAGGGSEPAEAGGKPFDRDAATAALSEAADEARACKQAEGPTGRGEVEVTFAPSGDVTSADVEGPPFAGTPVGGCVGSAFRGIRVPAFDGSPVTMTKSFDIE